MAQPEYLDIELAKGKTFTHKVNPEHTVIAYVIDGEGYFDAHHKPFSHDVYGSNYFDMQPPCECKNGTLVLFERGGDHIIVTADESSVRFLLISGKPLNEPIAWYGPIVMNTKQELEQAFAEYANGTFIKR